MITYHLQLPEGDVVSRSYKEFLAELDVCMGGRAAEEMVFGKDNVTSGASSDLHKATDLARKMVCLYGMSPEVCLIPMHPSFECLLTWTLYHANPFPMALWIM